MVGAPPPQPQVGTSLVGRAYAAMSGTVLSGSTSLSVVFQNAAKQLPSVTIDAQVQGGAPVVRGTRVPIHSVLRAIEDQGTLQGAIHYYPDLNLDQVKDALYFARMILESSIGVNQVASAS
jgi:uncharacterized protein (DUF433 family)